MNTDINAAFASTCIASATACKGRMLAVVLAGAALSASLASHANEQDAMDACIKAFVATSLPKDQPVRVRKDTSTPGVIDGPGRTYRISLTATGVTSGKRFARGTCLVDRSGSAIALNGKPLPDDLAN